MFILLSAIGLLVLSSGAQPNLTAYMASLVRPSETGMWKVVNSALWLILRNTADTLNAAISIIQNLMAIVSPLVFLGLYSLTVKKAPAITFLALAVGFKADCYLNQC